MDYVIKVLDLDEIEKVIRMLKKYNVKAELIVITDDRYLLTGIIGNYRSAYLAGKLLSYSPNDNISDSQSDKHRSSDK